MSTPERTALYRCFDVNDDLLYIGISKNPKARWEQHRKTSAWWGRVVTRTVEWFDSREDAARAERTAIRTEGPQHNNHHKVERYAVARVAVPSKPGRTLSDVYADRDLTDAQARRIVALLGLTQPRDGAGSPVPTPPVENTPSIH